MKRIYCIVPIFSIGVAGAQAQDEEALRVKARALQAQSVADQVKMQVRQAELQAWEQTLQGAKVYSVGGAVMGATVKNAPYSAVELTETTQVLADGNRIHHETQTTVYRDSEGRVRRETPDQVTIWDPVANTSYSLSPKTRTARKMPLGFSYVMTAPGGVYQNKTFVMLPLVSSSDGPVIFSQEAGRGGAGFRVATGGRGGRGGAQSGKTESLGKQTVEGVLSDGTRVTSTIDAGVIGNDRPIQITSETWYSAELQTLVKSVRSDPRTGEEVFRLSNVSRVEPPSILFRVPADYQMVERK